jgi:hypothetical protein
MPNFNCASILKKRRGQSLVRIGFISNAALFLQIKRPRDELIAILAITRAAAQGCPAKTGRPLARPPMSQGATS